MQITERRLSDIRPYEKNPRRNDAAVEYVAESLQQFGWKQPIVIDKNGVIIAGHTRYKAALSLGMETAPCLIADDLTPEQVKAYRLADNKVAEASEWNMELLDAELAEIMDAMPEFDMADFGFDLDGVSLDEQTEAVEDDYDAQPPAEPKTKRGDIYQLGRHRLMCGDSTSNSDVQRLMNGNEADLVLTDPPYGMHLDTDYSTIHGSLKSIGRKNNTSGNKYEAVIGDNEDFSDDLILTIFNNFGCKEIFLFGADYYAELLPDKNKGSWLVWDKRKESQADAIGSEFVLIWSREKHKRRMLRHDWFGFLSSENQFDARNRVHPTQKPVTLLVDILTQWGKDSVIVVDLYGGSGSTLIACEQTNRNCYMMELEPRYCDVIVDRWERLTGEKAVLIQ